MVSLVCSKWVRPNQYNYREDDEYRKFFQKKLKEYGVNSPDELSDKRKKKFFKEKPQYNQKQIIKSTIYYG